MSDMASKHGQFSYRINGGGSVNALDLTGVKRIIAGLDAPTPGADANQDGKITAIDITSIKRIIAGLD